MARRKLVGFLLGPALFILALTSPVLEESPDAHRLLAIFLLVVVWWVTECIPIPMTALLIPVLITALGVAPAPEALAPFANPIIFLFLGSFVLARAMCVHGLDRKLAYTVLSHRSIGGSKIRILFAMGLVSLVLSMWLSNTATTAMMFPIALGVLDAIEKGDGSGKRTPYRVLLLLTLAYAASIGGVGTPIGSPPNLIAIGMLEKLAGYHINFFQWMLAGSLVLLPMYAALFFLMRTHIKATKPASNSVTPLVEASPQPKGLTRAQKNVLLAFSVTVCLWVLPGVVSLVLGRDSGLYLWLHARFPEAIAAIIGALLLFALPVDPRRGIFTLELKDAMRIDWGTLLLFGGGLSLGFQMFETGLADAIGRAFISLGGNSAGPILISLLAISLSVFLTELTSNTASANMIIPIIIAISQAAGIDPLPPVLGSAIGCSFAFMLPVATPPNAIVYGSGMIPLPKMMRFGFLLNIVGILIIWLMITVLAPAIGLI
ncbi:MAG: DASS family sodium-coupled anion symporter [Candidatus Aminicenantaceae bacterium]